MLAFTSISIFSLLWNKIHATNTKKETILKKFELKNWNLDGYTRVFFLLAGEQNEFLFPLLEV